MLRLLCRKYKKPLRAYSQGTTKLLISGPGTGKTSFLVNRTLDLISEGSESSNILLLTPWEKGSQLIKKRFDNTLSISTAKPCISSIGLFAGLLLGNEEGTRLQDTTTPTYPTQMSWIQQQAFFLSHSKEILPSDLPSNLQMDNSKVVSNYLLDLEQNLVTPKSYFDFIQFIEDDIKEQEASTLSSQQYRHEFVKNQRVLATIFEKFVQLKQTNKQSNFNNMLYQGIKSLQSRPCVLDSFSHIFVDDLHYFTPIQFELLRLILEIHHRNHREIIVTGDPDQRVIHGLRSCSYSFEKMQEDFPGIDIITSNGNFRSTGSLLKASSRLLQRNFKKKVRCVEVPEYKGEPVLDFGVKEICFPTEKEEFDGISQIVSTLQKSNKGIQIGIVCPTNFVAEKIAHVLKNHANLSPLKKSLLDSKEIRFLLSLLTVSSTPENNEEIFDLLYSANFHIPPKEISTLVANANHLKQSIWDTIREHPTPSKELHDFIQFIQKFQKLLVPGLMYQNLLQFIGNSRFFEHLRPSDSTGSPFELPPNHKRVHDLFPEGNVTAEEEQVGMEVAVANLNKFIEMIQKLETQKSYRDSPYLLIQHLKNVIRLGEHQKKKPDGNQIDFLDLGKIEIVQIFNLRHEEYDVMIFPKMLGQQYLTKKPMLDDTLKVPDPLVLDQQAREVSFLEDQRRFIYLAISRARQGIFFTYCSGVKGGPSRFISELFGIPIRRKQDISQQEN